MQTFTHLPLGMPGQVYRSAMPYSYVYDINAEIYPAYQKHRISTVVVLMSEEEIFEKSGKDLLSLYTGDGLKVIHLPIIDWGIPNGPELQSAVEEAYLQAQAGHNIAIHCHAGLGRTGMFSACLARKALGLTGEESTAWVRKYIPNAVENSQQGQMVKDFQP